MIDYEFGEDDNSPVEPMVAKMSNNQASSP